MTGTLCGEDFDGGIQDPGLPQRRSLSKALQAQAKRDDPILV